MENYEKIAAFIVADYLKRRETRDGERPAEDFLEHDIAEAIKKAVEDTEERLNESWGLAMEAAAEHY